MIAAHGNSLRGIIKYLKNIPDDEIIHLNQPTAVPYIFEFDDNLNFVKDYFLDDPEKIKKLMDAVAHQGKSQNKLNTKNVPGYPPPIFILFLFQCPETFILLFD